MINKGVNFSDEGQYINYVDALHYMHCKNPRMTSKAVKRLINKSLLRYKLCYPKQRFSLYKYVPQISNRHWLECLDITYEMLKGRLKPVA